MMNSSDDILIGPLGIDFMFRLVERLIGTTALVWLVFALGFSCRGSAESPLLQVDSATVGMSADRLERIDEVVSEGLRQERMPGCVVLVGRGSNIITANVIGALHVRLVAPIEFRIRHIEEFYEMSKKEAVDYLHVTDKARKRYVKRYFNSDIDDPLDYDLTTNTGRTGLEGAVRIIADATPKVPVEK